jgi:nucleotide-binding universal stress UspA family protein
MFEKIVVGVSKAESAQKAARYAIDMATKYGAELNLVMAFDDKDDSDRRHAEGFLESMAMSTVLTTRTHALPGDPAAALLQVADEIGADLIVIGNRGMKGAGRILGSVPNSVAHKAPCSVMIVNTT